MNPENNRRPLDGFESENFPKLPVTRIARSILDFDPSNKDPNALRALILKSTYFAFTVNQALKGQEIPGVDVQSGKLRRFIFARTGIIMSDEESSYRAVLEFGVRECKILFGERVHHAIVSYASFGQHELTRVDLARDNKRWQLYRNPDFT